MNVFTAPIEVSAVMIRVAGEHYVRNVQLWRAATNEMIALSPAANLHAITRSFAMPLPGESIPPVAATPAPRMQNKAEPAEETPQEQPALVAPPAPVGDAPAAKAKPAAKPYAAPVAEKPAPQQPEAAPVVAKPAEKPKAVKKPAAKPATAKAAPETAPSQKAEKPQAPKPASEKPASEKLASPKATAAKPQAAKTPAKPGSSDAPADKKPTPAPKA